MKENSCLKKLLDGLVVKKIISVLRVTETAVAMVKKSKVFLKFITSPFKT